MRTVTSSTDKNKLHIIAFALITALCLLGDSMLYISLPVHVEDVGLSSLWEVGILLSMNRIVRLPLNPWLGKFYNYVSERTGILIAVLLAVGTSVSYAFADSFFVWVIIRCVWGVAWGLLRLGSLFCILNLSTHENRGHYTGLYNGLYRLGSLVGMLLGGFLADNIGIRPTALIFAAGSAVAIIPVFIFIPKETERQNIGGNVKFFAGIAAIAENNAALWLVLGGTFVALTVQGALGATMSLLINAHIDGGVILWGTVFGAASIGGLFQALRWGWEPWLAPAFGRAADSPAKRRKILLYALAGGGAVFILVALPLPLPLWFCCLLGVQLSATALTTLMDAKAADSAATEGGRSLLVNYALAADIGAAIGPLTAYLINRFFGINAAYAVFGLLFGLFYFQWARVTKKEA